MKKFKCKKCGCELEWDEVEQEWVCIPCLRDLMELPDGSFEFGYNGDCF